MLTSLNIKNIVLIEHLSLSLTSGLTVLTGETGAGKSILLDSLGLALGKRADIGLIRQGCDQGQVIAEFDIQNTNHIILTHLQEHDIECDTDAVIIRRVLKSDGKSKCYINDTPVSLSFLKTIGQSLIEIHGQFDTSGLLDPKTHLETLDQFGNFIKEKSTVETSFQNWKTAQKKLKTAHDQAQSAREQEEYLKHAVAELEALNPQLGEESTLSQKRKYLMAQEKITTAYNTAVDILDREQGIEDQMRHLSSTIENIQDDIDSASLTQAIEAINRSSIELEEARGHLDALISYDDSETIDPNTIEERLFALKDCARKHNCQIDDLPQVVADLQEKLNLVEHFEETLNALENDVKALQSEYHQHALHLYQLRQKAAAQIEKHVMAELPDLKLDKAKFKTTITLLENPAQWTAQGINTAYFQVATNPGSDVGDIHKVASGGELARFMLALKMVLAKTSNVPTLIFDEVDSGIGGATADAVGKRLHMLSQDYQILVVTHSPQVAAKGAQQFQVIKSHIEGMTDTTASEVRTQVIPLNENDRLEEIARMLSGAQITNEARAAAARLIETKAA